VPTKCLPLATAAALLIGLPAAASADTFSVPDWQSASNLIGLPLLAPAAPSDHEMAGIRVRTLSCYGRSVDYEVEAIYVRADGSRISYRQARPYVCTEGGDPEDLGTQVVGGRSVDFYSWMGDPGTCWEGPEAVCVNGSPELLGASFGDHGTDHFIVTNHGVQNSVQALVGSLQVVEPEAGNVPVVDVWPARIVAVLRPDRILVRTKGRVRTLRLAGLRAPQPGQCGYSAALQFTRRFAQKGRTMLLEVDPLLSIGGLRPVGTLWRKNRAATTSLNLELAARGLGRLSTTATRYRTFLQNGVSAAKGNDNGIWGPMCERPARPVPATPVPATPRRPSTPPSRPATPAAPGDIYNCGDFPLSNGTTAADYLRRYPSDPSRLDGDGNGRACE